MADERLRRLERAATYGGAQVEGRLLAERLRSGRLPRKLLGLAAHINHPPALHALGLRKRPEPADPVSWVRSLLPWGRPVVIRALVAAARVVQKRPSNPVEQAQLRAAESYSACPCTKHAERAYKASRQVASRGTRPSYYLVMAAHLAGHMKEGEHGDSSVLSMAAITLREVHVAGGAKRAVLEAMRASVVDWALAG